MKIMGNRLKSSGRVGVNPDPQFFHCCFRSQKISEELLTVEPVRLDQEGTEVILIHASY